MIWWIMVDALTGVDANHSHGRTTPFTTESSRLFQQARNEVERKESSKSLLLGPPKKDSGPERGRLDRLYEVYKAHPTEENRNHLLVEVERYARRTTLGKGGKYAQHLHQSVTDQYPQTEVSTNTAIKVWRSLGDFDGRSKFSVWVFRIARNVVKDTCRQIRNRGEVDLLEWRDYDGDYAGSRAASASSADGEFVVTARQKSPLPSSGAPDERKVKLYWLVLGLSEQDQHIIYLVQEGYKPAEIGEEFGKSAKWASNNLNRLKKLLKKRAAEEFPVAKSQNRSVLVMKGNKTLPASAAAA